MLQHSFSIIVAKRSVVLQVVKIAHVLSVMLWVGTLFVLLWILRYGPRKLGLQDKEMQTLCKKIYTHIDLPSMVCALGTAALLLVFKEINFKAGWFHMKMTGVLLLISADYLVRKAITSKKTGTVARTLYTAGVLFALVAIYIFKP
jgi:uncharacterized membrane protein